ncbi:helix-turn-helix domain-containing protein [Nocardia uniformis]|uniref:Helix-turn-helix domain-containing protein n=1 Tax=Nocardia uniformis TaxID=53432 RepID=A0A849CHW7_9NOCA|nr:helix-turn-helix domain-containing protein [Nocardia uniformis]
MSGSLQEAREALGQRLRELRRAAGMSGRNLAELAGWHESKVSKLEHGTRPPTEMDIRAYCEILGASEQLPDLLATVRNLDSAYVEWRRVLSSGTKRGQHSLAKLAERTKLMRVYQPYVVPGLLQTADYAEAILRQAIDFYRIPDDLDNGVAERIERQQILYRGDRRFHILMGEQALSTGVANADVMTGQLDRLMAVIGLPRVTFGIVPATAYCPAPAMNFVMYDRSLVVVEGVTAELKITQPREIAQYGRAFDILASQSTTCDAARALIRNAISAQHASSTPENSP